MLNWAPWALLSNLSQTFFLLNFSSCQSKLSPKNTVGRDSLVGDKATVSRRNPSPRKCPHVSTYLRHQFTQTTRSSFGCGSSERNGGEHCSGESSCNGTREGPWSGRRRIRFSKEGEGQAFSQHLKFVSKLCFFTFQYQFISEILKWRS